jgi:DNA-binding Xre family transcriptional regulator
MAAPEGNRFWELRSKHGRDKLFETPQLMWEAACEYFQWCEDNPLIEIDFKTVDKELQQIELPKMRAFTLHGLCSYLDCSIGYFRQFKRTANEDFLTVIDKIEETVYNQKFTGSAAGFLNANIIARDLGLSDKQDLNLAGSVGIAWNEVKKYETK